MDSLERLLEDLDPEQREVAYALNGPVCVRAGAGTGKTRAITYRAAYGIRSGVYDPSHMLLLTFTTRAAEELRGRLRLLGVPSVQARTFHSAALSQLKYFWPYAVGGEVPRLESNPISFISEAALRLGLPSEQTIIADVEKEMEWAKVCLVEPQSYVERAARAGRSEIPGCEPERIAQLLELYEDVKTAHGVIDHNDVLLLLLGILLDRDDIARQVRTQYKRFVVDEYQDVSPLQHRLLQVWLGRSQEICVVGDAAQTIYSFAGARATYLSEFTKEFPRARVIDLVRDYRSSPQIVDYANKVMARSHSDSLTLISQNPPAAPVAYREYSSPSEEAEAIARTIARLWGKGKELGDMAILYRTNSQSRLFEQALNAQGIPSYTGGVLDFFKRSEVRNAMVRLRSLAHDGVAGDLVSNVQTALLGVGWANKAPKKFGAEREKWECLNAIVELSQDMYQSNPDALVIDFVRELECRAKAGLAPKVQAIALTSLHGAKGLEWDTVFLAGISEGLVPISYAATKEAIEEERRLFYVGVTRAKTALHISCSAPRAGAPIRPSRFLP